MIKTDIISKIIRYFASYLTYTRIIPKPNFRPEGISAIVRVWNEEIYLEQSINSIKDFVDEIIAVDTGSTDNSWKILNKLRKNLQLIKIFQYFTRIPWQYSNFVLKNTTYRWILKWDADLVSIINNGKNELSFLRSFIFSLNKNIYYYLKIPVIELAGDFYHQFPQMRIRKDIEIFTYSQDIKYIPVERYLKDSPYPYKLPYKYEIFPNKIKTEGLKIPYYYRISEVPKCIAYHLNIKSPLHLLTRYFWPVWLAFGVVENNEIIKLEDYIADIITKKWKFSSIEEAANFLTNEFRKSLVEYDISLGELPDNIKTIMNKFKEKCDDKHSL